MMMKFKRIKNKNKSNKVFQLQHDHVHMIQNEREGCDLKASLESSNHDDLYQQTRAFFLISRFVGIIPFSGMFSRNYLNLTFSHFSIPSLTSLAIVSLMSMNLIIECIQATQVSKRNTVELSVAVNAPIFFSYGLFVYVYCYIRARKIIALFHSWMDAQTEYFASDKNLRRHVISVSTIFMTSAIIENGILHLKYFQKFDTLNDQSDVVLEGYSVKHTILGNESSILETYYRRSHYDWSNVLGYNEIYAILFFISNKWTFYSWNYIDLLLCVYSRALYFRFKCLYEISKKTLLSDSQNGRFIGFKNNEKACYEQQEKWLQLVKDHETLCSLLKDFESVLSPLIFFSYVINVFYLCMQIYMGLHTEDSGPRSIIHSVYAPWSLLHLGARMYLVSICLARVNVHAHKIKDVIIECPLECYDKNISRLDRRVTSGRKIAFTGLQCFTVTKPFMLQIISVIFTFEIVLLGFSTGSDNGQCCCKSDF